MKAKSIAGLLACCLAAAGVANAAGAPPPDLAVARKALAKAIAAHDLKEVAGLSHFPLVISEFQMPPTLPQQKFLTDKARFTDIFADGQTVDCIRDSAPDFALDPKNFGADSWSIDCNGYDYYFAKRDGGWRLIGFANINE